VEVALYRSRVGRSPIEEFIRGLPKEDQARFADIHQGIKEHGLDCPRVIFKPLRGKLWEMKFNAKAGGYRISYVVVSNSTMVWLHVFTKKTQKTSARDLQIAEQRMKEVLNYET
jgi:phage-related protein